MKTLYIHIGTPKTGTTAIQNFCHNNEEVLHKKGYDYPILYTYYGRAKVRNAQFLHLTIYNRDTTDKKDRDIAEENRRITEGMQTIASLFETYHNIILSDEGLWKATQKRRASLWEELKEHGEKHGYQVKVIVYLRRQDEFVESWYNQRIKHELEQNNTLTWEEYSRDKEKNCSPDYYQRIKAIERVLGKENIIVRRYNFAEFKNGMIQADFLDAIGLEWTDEYEIIETDKNRNDRLQGNALEFKRIINQMKDLSRAESRMFEKILLELSEQWGKQYPCRAMNQQEAMEFMKEFESDNQKLAEEYINDGKPLFTDRYKDNPKWDENNPYVLENLLQFICTMQVEMMRNKKRFQEEELPSEIDRRIRNNRFTARVKRVKKRILK
ncbi:hypothetical protein [Eubacterium oxidoreducens]|uniref:Sulfotransferase family protein n=1 Tax=Eubacterium oxidoreducens TaxID=1732 RepID=A0A1G6BMF9_EUBOX|nr:hypothetical protein [Eubacterium oxidoreducens]SDB21775.1 hypothetical protein SAMN02910417_01634 [Eubacterium oxidoreducens]